MARCDIKKIPTALMQHTLKNRKKPNTHLPINNRVNCLPNVCQNQHQI